MKIKIKRETLLFLISSLGLVSISGAALILAMMMLGRIARAAMPWCFIAAGVLFAVWIAVVVIVNANDYN